MTRAYAEARNERYTCASDYTAPAKPKQADAVTPKPPAAKTEPKAAQPTREAVPPAPSAQAQPPASEEQPTQPVSNPLHSFDLQVGVNDILYPGRGEPNV